MRKRKVNIKASRYKKDLVENATNAEIMFKTYLRKADIEFRFQYIIQYSKNENHFYISDFYLPDYNILVEIDGEYHNTQEQRFKDNHRDSILTKMGFGILRLSNQEIYEINYLDLKKMIGDFKFVLNKRKKRSKEIKANTNKYIVFTSYSQIFTFGKYKGKTLEWLLHNNNSYIDWLIKNNIIKISTSLK